MLKRDVVEQLKGILEYQEDNLDEYQHYNAKGNFAIDEMEETYKKDIEALKVAIKAVDAFDYDERDEITITVKAMKAAEGDAYYFDLETGERLVIREGKIEGIYNPGTSSEVDKWKDYFKRLTECVTCYYCPYKYECSQELAAGKCAEFLLEKIEQEYNKDHR